MRKPLGPVVNPPRPESDPSCVQEINGTLDYAETLVKSPVADMTFDFVTSEQAGERVARIRAREAVRQIASGRSVKEAADSVGVTQKALLSDGEFRKKLQYLERTGAFPPQFRAALVRAIQSDIAVRNLGVDDKISLDATKAMQQDPELGMQVQTQVGVQINLGDLLPVLDAARPIFDDKEKPEEKEANKS